MADFNGTLDSNIFKTKDGQDRDVITLDTRTLFDDTIGDFDSPSGNFDLGGTDSTSNPNFFNKNIKSEGFYDFFFNFDAGAVFDVTFQVNIGMSTENEYDLFDSGRGAAEFDGAKGPFDGSFEIQCGCVIQVGASNTSFANVSTFSNTTSQATEKGRFFKLKARLFNFDNTTKPKVHSLGFTVALEKRTETGNDIVSGTGTKSVTFTNGFYQTPALGIAAQNMSTGDTFSISNKSGTGFDIAFTNSSGSGISRTFDFLATGHGFKS
tara:strand:- start:2026 stop:2823 length:798 start_codon:yes stop_codon:yes gene_type:complete